MAFDKLLRALGIGAIAFGSLFGTLPPADARPYDPFGCTNRYPKGVTHQVYQVADTWYRVPSNALVLPPREQRDPPENNVVIVLEAPIFEGTSCADFKHVKGVGVITLSLMDARNSADLARIIAFPTTFVGQWAELSRLTPGGEDDWAWGYRAEDNFALNVHIYEENNGPTHVIYCHDRNAYGNRSCKLYGFASGKRYSASFFYEVWERHPDIMEKIIAYFRQFECDLPRCEGASAKP